MQSPNSGMEQDVSQSSITSMATGMMKEGAVSKPIYIYKVSVEDEKEELVRTVELGGLTMGTLKDILGASNRQFAYNTLIAQQAGGFGGIVFMFSSMLSDIWSLSGIPASFIVPDALLIEEMEVQKEKRAITIKKPVVQNPVGK